MKSYLLFFLVFVLLVSLLPFSAFLFPETASAATSVLTVNENGAIYETDTEEYVLRALLAASDKELPAQALRAIAVALRSCACFARENRMNHPDFDLCSESGCCFKLADAGDVSEAYAAECAEAVETTRGEVLCYEGLTAVAPIHPFSGRRTAASEAFPYIVSVDNSAEAAITAGVCVSDWSYEAFSNLLCVSVADADAAAECSLVYDENGYCVFGIFGKKTLSAQAVADALSIPSLDFSFEYTETGIKITSYGSGSCFGMSLNGAKLQAESEIDYRDILKYYYPLLTLTKTY